MGLGADALLSENKLITQPQSALESNKMTDASPKEPIDSIVIINSTFLGNDKRAWYGNELPDTLEVVWKTSLGKGITYVRGDSAEEWMGAGWTGQPLLVEVHGIPYLIQGSFDHKLRKIDARDGNVVWEYDFGDIIKGTGTLWLNPNPDRPENRLLVMQGSRLGNGRWLSSDTIPSYRAISFFTGEELWRMQVERGPSFSRDVDGSAIVIENVAYIGLENGIFRKFDPSPTATIKSGGNLWAQGVSNHEMYRKGDGARHGGELVVESSPCRIGNHIYITCGSGHVFGYNIDADSVDWDYYIGSDLDGSPVVTADSCILVTVEKQFIAGRGGLLKLNPRKPIEHAVEWYLPVKNREFATWHGGIIGSPAISDYTGFSSNLAATAALDGKLYLVNHNQTEGTDIGYDQKTTLPTPKTIFTYETGPSISSPIFAKNRLLVATYTGIYLFEYNKSFEFKLLAKLPGGFESTPFCHNGRVYVASRNGYLYCFGRLGAT